MSTTRPDPAGPVDDDAAGGILHIDLAALAANWRLLRDAAGGAEAAAVVKANAYGIGIEQAVPTLARAGCASFFVAHLSEAIRARAVAPEATIYVLNGLFPGTSPHYRAHRLRPVLGSSGEIDEWAGFCRAQSEALPAALHVDTGMNRLGLGIPEGMTLKDNPHLADFAPSLLMSHFVGAEENENPLNARQVEAFSALRETLPGIPASLSNSSGIFLRDNPQFDLVRPGYALYGGNPTPYADNPMNPVVGLEVRVVQIRTIEAGETVGYNGRWVANDRRRVATLSVGYADGYPRAASGRGASGETMLSGMALVAGHSCPFAGNVSMDLIIVDITDVPDGAIARGDCVTLIGGDLTIDEVGRRAGTIGYEILTNLGARYARQYREAAP
ncbi:alanine racemase [Microvirga antarctica]|uniref:alanine racemase n=1 Tax=Microvirga antarctica TaxID=2819233 RepID=UPI001B30DBF3|nr:alanine racemase [Microvirga antarctica]